MSQANDGGGVVFLWNGMVGMSGTCWDGWNELVLDMVTNILCRGNEEHLLVLSLTICYFFVSRTVMF